MNGTVTVLAASADTRRGLTIGLFATAVAVLLLVEPLETCTVTLRDPDAELLVLLYRKVRKTC